MTAPVLEIADLVVALPGGRRVVDGVSLRIDAGETVGLVGESGSGKSMTAYAVLGLFPARQTRQVAGDIRLHGRSLHAMPPRRWRGRQIGMVFQDPSGFLDPLLTAGRQIGGALRAHGAAAGPAQIGALLDAVELSADIAGRYPHELSGGQRQRVMIAAALALRPALLIADEPTTALDATVQAGVLAVLRRLQADMGLAVLLITHDLGVLAQTCRRVYVMYAGQIVEHGETRALLRDPRHPYTQGLRRSVLDPRAPRGALFAIPGAAPAGAMPPGCRFHPRCPIMLHDPCATAPPMLTGDIRCWRSGVQAWMTR